MGNNAKAIPRLNIPEYNWWNECLHGVARAGTATVFPQAIGLAATWNTELMSQVADVISTEARAKYNDFIQKGDRTIFKGLTFWSPNINIFRDPRWGRGQETYGEDPYLTSRMGVAFVKGLQGDDPKYFKVIATPKHYAVHSGPEPDRHTFDAIINNRDLYETYLPAFEACIKEAGAFSVMCAYNRFMGEACCGQRGYGTVVQWRGFIRECPPIVERSTCVPVGLIHAKLRIIYLVIGLRRCITKMSISGKISIDNTRNRMADRSVLRNESESSMFYLLKNIRFSIGSMDICDSVFFIYGSFIPC